MTGKDWRKMSKLCRVNLKIFLPKFYCKVAFGYGRLGSTVLTWLGFVMFFNQINWSSTQPNKNWLTFYKLLQGQKYKENSEKLVYNCNVAYQELTNLETWKGLFFGSS